MTKQDGKIRKLIAGISNLGPSLPQEQIVFVSNNVAKVFDSKSSSFKNIELKAQEKTLEFVRLDSGLILDLPVARTEEKELVDDLAPAMEKLEENLSHCIFVFGNKLLQDNEVLGKPFDMDKKKGKGKNRNESLDEDDDNAQTIMNVELLMTGIYTQYKQIPDYNLPSALDSLCPQNVEIQPSVVRMKVAGKLCSRVYLAPGATVTSAKKEIVSDILRSMRTR